MINLLPLHVKKQVRAARANVLLVRYVFLLGIAVVFLVLSSGVVYFSLSDTRANAEDAQAFNKSKIANYASIETEAATFRTNLAIAKTILDKEVMYTNAILNIAQAIPAGVTINELTLNPQSFGSPIIISANAKTREAAVGLKDSLDKSEMFSDVHFNNISSGDEHSKYPYSITLGATISKDAAKR